MTSTNYHSREHSAVSTDDYIYSQLIPYIGSKRKLLPLIQLAVSKTGIKGGSFADFFSGSGVVSRYFKSSGYRVFCNDWEPYAKSINGCFISNNSAPEFVQLGGYHKAVEILNSLTSVPGWISRHLCPEDDDNYDVSTERMFYTQKNGRIIDSMRNQIEEWLDRGSITQNEADCLLAPLLYQACYTSNTSGVFKGFHNGWGGQTQTALYRIKSELKIKPAVFFDNRQVNAVYNMDALEFSHNLYRDFGEVDIAYLDPPYNQHPYGSNYHVLNTITLWDEPDLTPKIQGRNKAAIRTDWQSERRSPFNYKSEASDYFDTLITSIKARYILVSYSTDGMIPLDRMLESCISSGYSTFVTQEYKRYRVSSQRFSSKPLNVEFIIIIDTSKPHTGLSAIEMSNAILDQEAEANNSHSENYINSQPTLF